jgi:hypothetical protein
VIITHHLLTFCTGNLLLKRLLVAVPQAKQSKKDFIKFDQCLREENLEEVLQMERDVAAWAKDKSRPDPYRLPKSSE